MKAPRSFNSSWRASPWLTVALMVGSTALPVLKPALLTPIAGGYQAVCERFPLLALMTFHAPTLPAALVLALVGLALSAVLGSGVLRTGATIRTNVRLSRAGTTLPPRLTRIAANLGVAGRITFLADRIPVACCYGLLRPRIAISEGMLLGLDDRALTAVLAHERHHLRRWDPPRYLVLHACASLGFMLPLAPLLCDRLQARIELMADRAALKVSSPADVAAALRFALLGSTISPTGTAGLTSTEARIAQLSGTPRLPAVPSRTVVATTGVLIAVGGNGTLLGATADLVPMLCHFCTGSG